MSPSKNKKKRPSAGEDLINSLFDETSSKDSRTPIAPSGAPKNNSIGAVQKSVTKTVVPERKDPQAFDGMFELSDEDQDDKTPPPEATRGLVFNVEEANGFSLESSKPAVVVDATPLAGGAEDEAEWSPDYGALSAEDQYVPSPEFLKSEIQIPVPKEPEVSIPNVVVPSPEEERTMRLVVSHPTKPQSQPQPPPEVSQAFKPGTESRSIDRAGATEIRAGIRIPPAPKLSGPSSTPGAFSSSEASLKQSESLRIAQGRITELEAELERVRRDNESLSTAGDTLRRRADELLTKTESLDIQAREATHLLEEERRIMRGQLQAKDRDNAEMRARVEEIETRLESNFKKIRVRERELEHRLEIVKMESATLVSTKDKMILDLKRQIDQLTHEHDYAKTKTQELYNQYKDKQETQRRVVRALRIALTIIEGDDETVVPLRKAE